MSPRPFFSRQSQPARLANTQRFAYLIFGLLISCITLSVQALELIMEDNYEPFTYVEGGVAKGSYTDIVRKTMALLGEDIPITGYPFARGLEMLKTKSQIAMFALVQTPAREPMFKWACPIGTDATYVARHAKSDAPNFANLEKLAESGYQLGVINGWAAHSYLQGKKFERLDVSYNMEMLLKKFVNRRSDYIVLGGNDIQAQERAGLEKGLAVPLFKLYDTKKCLAFSLDVPDPVVRKWQQALDKVQAAK